LNTILRFVCCHPGELHPLAIQVDSDPGLVIEWRSELSNNLRDEPAKLASFHRSALEVSLASPSDQRIAPEANRTWWSGWNRGVWAGEGETEKLICGPIGKRRHFNILETQSGHGDVVVYLEMLMNI
jgi:hypothetical protein